MNRHYKTPKRIYGSDLNDSDLLLNYVEDKETLDNILASFGIYSYKKISKYPVHYSATCKKAIVGTKDGLYFLKEKAKYSDDDRKVDFCAKYQDYLSNRLRQVPTLLKTGDGNPYVRYGNRVYILSSYISGSCFMGKERQLESAAYHLAKIHNLSFGFIKAVNSVGKATNKINSVASSRRFIQLADNLTSTSKSKIKQLAISNLDTHLRSMEDRPQPGVSTAIHGDYIPSNLLFSPASGEVVGIFDFDNCGIGYIEKDVAESLMSFCSGLNYKGSSSNLAAPISRKIDNAQALSFLSSYCRNAEFVTLDKNFIDRVIDEIMVQWPGIMCLGIVRGDFGYLDILSALDFISNTETLRSSLKKNLLQGINKVGKNVRL